jgi:putative phosphoribosyl transferase
MPLLASARAREAVMQSPVAVRFQGVPLSAEVEREIERQAEELERFYDRITSCRVVVTTPHRHHRRGRRYHVRIDLCLPSGEVVVHREPGLDPAHEDPLLAVRDAFRAARRQLTDHVHRARGFVKHHEEAEPVAALLPIEPLPHDEEHGRSEVHLVLGEAALAGTLIVPGEARALVLFVHGSGGGHVSPRNGYMAGVLASAHVATLLADLLTWEESRDPRRVIDVDLVAERALQAVDWIKSQAHLRGLKLGLAADGTGAAAALIVAAESPQVGAVVARSGRPDLAGATLPLVAAPTLLIVGQRDAPGLRHNRSALAQMHCPRELLIVPGAGHLLEEPGALRDAARHAREWFVRHLEPAGS